MATTKSTKKAQDASPATHHRMGMGEGRTGDDDTRQAIVTHLGVCEGQGWLVWVVHL